MALQVKRNNCLLGVHRGLSSVGQAEDALWALEWGGRRGGSELRPPLYQDASLLGQLEFCSRSKACLLVAGQ